MVPHILCSGFTREETEYVLLDLQFLGITDLLVLRGDKEMCIRDREMMPETALTVESRYQGNIDKYYLQLLPKFALQYDFARNRGNVYAAVSKGYRSGGYTCLLYTSRCV